MIEKLFGMIKAKECMSRIKALRDDYEDKLLELREYISKLERKIKKIENENLELKVNKGRNFKLENENLKLKKENLYLKRELKNKEFIALSNRVAWSMGEWYEFRKK